MFIVRKDSTNTMENNYNVIFEHAVVFFRMAYTPTVERSSAVFASA